MNDKERIISQDFFDDVCVENAELLDLGEDEAVKETLQQLGVDQCAYLVQTFPSDACPERQSRRDFVDRLKRFESALSGSKQSATHDAEEARNNETSLDPQPHENDLSLIADDLNQIQKRLEEDFPVYSRLFEASEGVKCLTTLLSSDSSDNNILQREALSMLVFVLQNNSKGSLQQLQLSSNQTILIQWFKRAWKSAANSDREGNDCDETLCVDLLSLAYNSCKGNQFLKHRWMNDSDEPKLAHLLVGALSQLSHRPAIIAATCTLVALICTFDDTSSSAQNDPSIATAHAHVHSFHGAGVLDALKQVLQGKVDDTSCLTAILQAIRSVAVHNDIVQALTANGILQQVVSLFRTNVQVLEEDDVTIESESASSLLDNRLRLLAGCLGIFRNVSANDDIKYSLCAGNMSVTVPMIRSMQLGMGLPSLQEHATGTIAAMALRQPHNAACLSDALAPQQVVQAMRKYPDRASLQRQGCLAIRNLASRADSARKEELLGLTQETLQGIAAKHLECQDEVYAALRDMGIHQSHSFAVQDADTGVVNLVERQTFGGGHNSKFRAVYE